MEGATVLGTATLANGVATLKGASTTFTTLGTHAITAKYFGDAGHNASTSEAFNLVVCTAPDAPTIGTATEGDAKATVSFTPAAYDGGSPITGYTVTATPEKSGKSVTLTVPATGIEAGKEHTLEVTGLTNGTKYSFTVTASNAALTSVPSAAATTPIRLTHQPEITWDINTDIVYGTALDKTMLNPTADVPGSFSYNYSLGTVLNVGDGQMLIATFTPTDQDANIGTTAIKNINVAKATPTISWNPPTIAYGTALGEAQLGAAALHKGATVLGTFTYTANGNALKVGDILAAGNHTLKVAFVPMPPFYALNFNSIEATATLTVDKATPAITWKAPLPITYGTKLSNEQLSATANVGGTFTYTPAIGTTLTAGEHILRATFTPTDAANYSSVEATATLTVDKATPAITWKAPSAIIYGTKLGDKQLSATADVEGAFTYTPALGATLAAGEHTLKATFTPTDATNYSSVEATATLTVDKATPATTWKAPSPITYGTKLGNEQLSATADVEGAFTYTPALGATLAAGEHTLRATFTPTDAANYSNVEATATLTVEKATPAVAWEAPSAITYGTKLGNAQLGATADIEGTFTYAPAAGTVLNAGQGQTLSVTFTPSDAANYNEATKSVTIAVAKAPLTATATSYSIREGEAIPALGVTYSGFVNGDTEAVLDTKPTATTTATATSPTGVYDITVAGGADDSYEFAYVAGKLTISNPIVVNALKAPQPACEGDKLSLAYTLTSGRPTEYQIVFEAKALTAGFSNSGYAALPTDDGTVSFSIPARVTDGTYQATLQLRDGYGNISEPAAFQVTVNVSADVIVPKFGSVVLIDNHDGRFTGYQWYKNGSAIGGATSQFYKDPNGLSGTYYAQLKTATGQTVNTCSKALSIKKSAQASVSVYPNPARAGQEFTVKLSGFADEELQGAVLTVYSTQGVPVLTSRKVEQENRITLSGTDGVYMGRIATADGQVLTFKVVLAN